MYKMLILYKKERTTLIPEYLELINGTLGMFLFILTLVLVKDLKKEFAGKGIKIQAPLTLFIIGTLIFSIGELYKYGPFEITIHPIIAELFETVYLILTLIAFFCLLRIKELPISKKK